MKSRAASFILLLLNGVLVAQGFWSFEEPKINTADFPILDTIYMSPDGNDMGDGSINSPVASFDHAMALLPFGVQGVNGGHSFGLVRLLPGDYVVYGGFDQSQNEYQKGSTYKNVSIEGIGEVTLRGERERWTSGHMIKLLGSHIYVRNVKIKYAGIHGVFIDGGGHSSDVLIDNVSVDSVRAFGMLVSGARNVKITNSTVLNSSRLGNEELKSPCSWPSGVKFINCEYVVCEKTEVAHSRGEGLNFQNTSYGWARNNYLHDNPANLYCDNSHKVIIEQNFIYSTPGANSSWLTCPGDSVLEPGSTGVLLANEGACDGGLGPVYHDCTTKCVSGSDAPHIDSIFIHNNIFVNTQPALDLWQGVTDILGGPNCLRNVHFVYNTVLGLTGGYPDSKVEFINAFFPNAYNTILGFGYATVRNLQINNNIFALPKDAYSRAALSRISLDRIFPVPFEVVSSNNAVNVTDDLVDGDDIMITFKKTMVQVNLDSILKYFEPCGSRNPELVHGSPLLSWVVNDYFSNPRSMENNNIGAIVSSDDCETTDLAEFQSLGITVFPNPAEGVITITVPHGVPTHDWVLGVCSIDGKILIEDRISDNQKYINLDVSQLNSGLYWLRISTSKRDLIHKVVVK